MENHGPSEYKNGREDVTRGLKIGKRDEVIHALHISHEWNGMSRRGHGRGIPRSSENERIETAGNESIKEKA